MEDELKNIYICTVHIYNNCEEKGRAHASGEGVLTQEMNCCCSFVVS